MTKASSTKKVARAARAGGKSTSKRKLPIFPIAMAAVVVLGLAMVVVVRNSGQSGATDTKNPPKVGDHWHASYGIYICDRFVPDVSDRGPDQLGVHTHDDGLIHIHPFLASAAGKQATLQRFFDQSGMQVSKSHIKLPSAPPFKGRLYEAGKTTCNGKPAVVEVSHWKNALAAAGGAKADKVFTDDFGKIRLSEDLGAYTFAFVAKGTKVPPPPGAGDILTNAQNDQAPQQGSPGAPGAPGSSQLPTELQPPGSSTP